MRDGLEETRLQMNFKADRAKWEDIYVPQKIVENLAQMKHKNSEDVQDAPVQDSQIRQRKGRKL